MAQQFKLILEDDSQTVAAALPMEGCPRRCGDYQSEAALEKELIANLTDQGYEYLPIKKPEALRANLRRCLEELNGMTFTDGEWERFFRTDLAGDNLGIVEKTRIIQEDYIRILHREDGTDKNIHLINKENIYANKLQVINQYVPEGGKRANRYDVTILVNGLPLVHIELKRRGVSLREAFNQIERYGRESFWAGDGLFDYVQLFVISNGTYSRYYSNSTRSEQVKKAKDKTPNRPARGGSYEFTSVWTDIENNPIHDIVDFAQTFLAKRNLLYILTRYCVFDSQNRLLVMRPYQIAATERILNRVQFALRNHKLGAIDAGGYIWHTTGSGKTLTSFKTSQLASQMEGVEKVMFVVDRKDLDYQTQTEFNRFEKGSVDATANTAMLDRQLRDPKSRILVTTIQKLANIVGRKGDHVIFDRPVVIIFDECHRSQFGKMHRQITRRFNKYSLFGFTGTPIFAKKNALNDYQTTEQAFGEKLHTYTIVDAIRDNNVLPFKVDYVSTMKMNDRLFDTGVAGIDTDKAFLKDERIKVVVDYIYKHYKIKTRRGESYHRGSDGRYASGFNSIFAVSSIEAAKIYYRAFQQRAADEPPRNQLKVATIYSFAPNEEIPDPTGLEEENSDSAANLDVSSKEFLASAIADYNKMFQTNFGIESFADYYKDVSQKVKERKIDILIVVSMFLTGFDSPTLNTLWVDKNLRYHGLLQAYSRTNRILNAVKPCGQIVCFRDLRQATDESIALFGDKEALGIALLRTVDDYYDGYDENGEHKRGYRELVEELLTRFPLDTMPPVGEMEQREFFILFGEILKMKNLIETFDQFGDERHPQIVTDRDLQDYQGHYVELHEIFRRRRDSDKADISDDLIYQAELVAQVSYDIDYIIELVNRYRDNAGQPGQRERRANIIRAIGMNEALRSKKELIEEFLDRVDSHDPNLPPWQLYVRYQLEREVAELIDSEKLKEKLARAFIRKMFKRGYVLSAGTELSEILPPISRFRGNLYIETRERVEQRLKRLLERYIDIFIEEELSGE
ncbi:MAG: type I restriction endonuclease subunit R [Thermoguttaceae bacterium]|nr:type I restriction endonuclease subunit R [Thermoguttaceae bacterium]